ncbi:MAG: hypothetical protein AUI21_01050 [Nitrospirae bacterium 13_1_40CM_2_62_10]|nr:MAG: hypothetical protein AUI21_01050 [Nitrospirae bacterium 13_1_40CM_2_62_10]
MIALTFDTDWMHPDDLQRFFDEYPFPGTGTIFLHQPYRFLESTPHERCPHPLPVGPEDWKASIRRLLDELGLEPSGIRTHSAIHSHRLEMALYELGCKYTSNTSRLFERNVQPVRLAWGLWELPIYYMDNLDLTMEEYWREAGHKPLVPEVVAQALQDDALYVFDFHPVHITLNTPSLQYYLAHHAELKSGVSPFRLQHRGRGVGSLFKELCAAMGAAGLASVALRQVWASATDRLASVRSDAKRWEEKARG